MTRARAPKLRSSLLGLLALCLLAAPRPAGAIVSNVALIDGPSASLGSEVDAAMAEDGSGGVVYLKQTEGRDHVFAAQYRNGVWQAAQRVDVGQDFDSSWPQIGAGDGGRLVVTWVQEFGVSSDRMFSATMDPGSSGFQDPVPVDFNVGEATSTFPDLAINRGGQGYLVYNVVTDTSAGNPPGYVGLDVRIARYGNRLWSVFSSPVDRGSTVPMRAPTEAIAPEVEIDIQGQGVVSWLEPDDEFIDRVWARRVFQTRVGIPLQVSPSAWEGLPLRGAADAFSLDVAGYGQAAVAFRQQPGQASALTTTRIMVNEMPEVFAELAGAFGQAQIVDGAALEAPGAPAVAVDPVSVFISGVSTGAATVLASGDNAAANQPERVDTGASSIAGEPLVDLAETGAGVVAWRELRGSAGLVRVQERRADGVAESTTLSAPQGGSIIRLELGGSSLGDAIVAWTQGTGAGSQVAATVVNAPPDPFLVLLPSGWQNDRKIPVSWQETLNAIGKITYSVSVDDEPVVEGVKGEKATLGRDDIDDGRHKVQIFAGDDAGQETGSRTDLLLVDRSRPRVKLQSNRLRLAVTVSDGTKRTGSGVKRALVSFGDGEKAKAKAEQRGKPARIAHRFKRRGSYRVTIEARDRAGNETVVRKQVRVR